VFSSVSEVLGFHFVIGAFFGALLLSHDLLGQRRFAQLQNTMESVSTGFLAPVFFASLGLQINLMSLKSFGFVTAVIVVGIVTKVVAGVVGGRLVGLPRADAWKIGAVLNGRGVMGIVVADIALQKGFIGEGLFATLILMSVVTTALTPLMIKGATAAATEPVGPSRLAASRERTQ
jgi:Kef-type K+ transport system membrane component KefB